MGWLRRYWAWLGGFGRRRTLGQRGEDAAARFLRRCGYRIVERGCRSRWGELDLVAVDRQTVVFVEVKTRTSATAGDPSEAVTPDKQRRLTRLAVGWLKRHRLLEQPARFDVVAVTWAEGCRRPKVDHYLNAFDARGRWEFFS
jgi:putative endonuclease